MNQLRLGLSQMMTRSLPLSTQLNLLCNSGRIVPACGHASINLNRSLVSNGSNNFSTWKTWFVEASPTPNSNSSGGNKPDESKPQEGETETESQLRAELSKAVSEVATLRAKSAEFEDKYMRALAEMENLRTRMTKQINDAKLFATQGFCKDLADIEDILQLAISSVPKDQTQSNKHLKELYEGLVMTEARLLQVFKNHGLSQINPLDDKFNPNEHEAVVQTEQPGKKSGTVIFVSKVGYKLHDRVIRPAVVGVAK
ncbi:unnamed protein product [Allacma fusca]|uniref:GrpE protein homolog n=1 Tax=Allacma fusca TaxID=39272 RepID=A0A8J2LM81_9HEXA|nr:unnamed protein product [Allacma fusca]